MIRWPQLSMGSSPDNDSRVIGQAIRDRGIPGKESS
jgi:hypothetical protein